MATYVKQHIRQETITTGWGWPKIKHCFSQLRKAISSVVSIDEEAIFKSRDWPYFWPKK